MSKPYLWVAKYQERDKTIFLPNGEKAKVTFTPTGDQSSVSHIEHGEVLDAVVRPATIRNKVAPSRGVIVTDQTLWQKLRQHWKVDRIRHV
jgi:hypothetical protein